MKIIIILCYTNSSENSITGNLMTMVNCITMTSMVCRWCVHVSGLVIIFKKQSYVQTGERHICALNFFSFFFTLSTSMEFLFWARDGLVLTTSLTPTHPLMSSTAVERRQDMGRTGVRKLMDQGGDQMGHRCRSRTNYCCGPNRFSLGKQTIYFHLKQINTKLVCSGGKPHKHWNHSFPPTSDWLSFTPSFLSLPCLVMSVMLREATSGTRGGKAVTSWLA